MIKKGKAVDNVRFEDQQNPPRDQRIDAAKVYLIFTASGAAALIYQVIWGRWLNLLFGNTTVSVAIVLSSFMLGLALGSHLVGRQLRRIANPMLVYVLFELGIGIFAILFPWLAQGVDILFVALVNDKTAFLTSAITRMVISFLLLMVPTILMGATLPLLTDFFRRHPKNTHTWRVGLLYAANTLGAAFGAFFASFMLIESIGVRSTTLIAALLNFLVALIGFQYSKGFVGQWTPPVETPVAANQKILTKAGQLALAVLAGSGAVALISEVLWTRTLEILVGASTYAFATILIVYLLGIAIGSWIMSLLVNLLKQETLPYWLVGLQAAMGVWTIMAISLFQGLTHHLLQHSGGMVHITVIVWSYIQSGSILFPLALLSGAVFPVATRIIDQNTEDALGEHIARAYAWNTVGAVIGSLIGGFLIAPWFDYFGALYFLAILYIGVALLSIVFIFNDPFAGPRTFFQKAICFCALAAIGGFCLYQILYSNIYIDHLTRFFKETKQDRSIVYHKPGFQGVVTVLKGKNKLHDALLINGRGMTVKVGDTKMMAHLPLLIHDNPNDTLVICFGMGTTYRSAISYGKKVTAVELVKEVYEAFDYFYGDAQRVRDYSKGRLVVDDGRNFLKVSQDHFDVITVDPPPPIDSAGVNNLYSAEFINLAKSRLKEGGIMAHWLPLPNTGAGVEDWKTFSMLLKTFAKAFPYTLAIQGLEGYGLHVLGSEKPISYSLEKIQRKLSAPAVKDDMNEWRDIPLEYFSQLSPVDMSKLDSFFILTDDRPYLEFYLWKTWLGNGMKRYHSINWY
ncbi:MAG: fused MFS/spermidine synthase [Candidatus Contendobacter sp.]|nr:fused MFS/spermidine synthase [Candidatus Contendobacter sp.]